MPNDQVVEAMHALGQAMEELSRTVTNLMNVSGVHVYTGPDALDEDANRAPATTNQQPQTTEAPAAGALPAALGGQVSGSVPPLGAPWEGQPTAEQNAAPQTGAMPWEAQALGNATQAQTVDLSKDDAFFETCRDLIRSIGANKSIMDQLPSLASQHGAENGQSGAVPVSRRPAFIQELTTSVNQVKQELGLI